MTNEEDIYWYHGNLSREGAEEVLRNARGTAYTNGLFLVRDSTTTPGDFVLSVLNENDEVLNFQIRQHGVDAFFSIYEEVIFHGLETLIDYYYKKDEAKDILPCELSKPVRGMLPPPHTLSHGRTNLLHRATKSGNLKVVHELLLCGNRNIEAKNEDGQTAVHVASIVGHENILERLLQANAIVNCRDAFGNTPLHYACQNNFVGIVRLLLNNGANVQLRNNNTGYVPLHEAASRGHKEIVELLLRVGAPARPRTALNKTPQQLAEDNGYYPLSHIIKTHEGPKPNSSREDWYHGTLSRDEAQTLLRASKSNTDGRFLIRYSENSGYVLTMVYNDQIYNYVISKQGPFYVIDDGPLLDSLEHVVEHYRTMSDGLPTVLQVPLKPKPKPPLPVLPFATLPSKGHRLGPRWSDGNATMPLPPKNKSRRPSDFSEQLRPPLHSTSSGDLSQVSVLISRESLILKEVIGEGEFGSVHRAIYQKRDGTEEEVAVKTLHMDHVDAYRESFLQEAELMMSLKHHCIVNLIGICRDQTPLMVQELVPLGSMLTFIQKYPEQVSLNCLHIWASQIALGMEYLEANRVVHRDLAARNILLASRNQAKVSDFGLSRPLSDNSDYYTATAGGRWPIKWYAPESYNLGRFSSASDVWSFGVTLWEMFSYGEPPFGELRGREVINLLDAGERLGQPELCPSEVYEVMQRCWSYAAKDRPSFSELHSFFASNTNYENIRHLVSQIDIT